MGITKQDIRNMFNENFKNLLNEEQISGVVDILYNSPTARNNLQRMKEYNDDGSTEQRQTAFSGRL